MKKIKITEKQAKLLETLNSKKVLKVTKEQYNRILESELNRPSLTETPELHQEEINEELFREFVNELYGMNEEGSECKYEKLTKVMEAAGLIEGGKLVKEKFGKDAKRVKEIVSKGLTRLEECGSVYEAVQMMEEMTSDEIKASFKQQLGRQSTNPNAASAEEVRQSSLAQSLAKDGPRVSGYPKGGKNNPQIMQDKPEPMDPNQLALELDEAMMNDKYKPFNGAKCIAVNNQETAALLEKNGNYYIFLFDIVKDDMGLVNVNTNDIEEYLNNPESTIYTDQDLNDYELFKELTTDVMEKILQEKTKNSSKFTNPFIWYVEQIYHKTKGQSAENLEEMTDTGAIANAQIVGPFGGKPAFKSNVSTELEEANVNLKDVIINIPDEDYLRVIKKTPTFRNYFSNKQLEDLHVGDNKLTVNHTVYGKMKVQYPEGRTPFGLKNESKLTSKIYEALKKK